VKKSPFVPILVLLLVTSALLGFSRMRVVHPGLGVYPEIAEFTAEPAAVRPGEPVTLAWTARGAVSVTLETIRDSDGAIVGEVQRDLPPVGTLKVQPRADTTWRMKCQTVFSGDSCEAAMAKVEVIGATTAAPSAGGF
jgi:hypothetical protein